MNFIKYACRSPCHGCITCFFRILLLNLSFTSSSLIWISGNSQKLVYTWGFRSKLLTSSGIPLVDLVSQVVHLNWSRRQLTELFIWVIPWNETDVTGIKSPPLLLSKVQESRSIQAPCDWNAASSTQQNTKEEMPFGRLTSFRFN